MSLIDDAIAQYRTEGIRGVLAGAGRFSQLRSRRAINRIASVPFDRWAPAPRDVIREDWDVLVLLDACRYDIFAQEQELEGDLEACTSVAGSSKTFLQRSFVGRELHDTVYVTGNPYVTEVPPRTFHAVEDGPLREGSDPDRGTIPPSAITDAARAAVNQYPHKRVIVHYMQPHMPPLGPTADRLDRELGLRGIEMLYQEESEGTKLFEAAEAGRIDRATVRQAYRETLQIVLEDVTDLLSSLEGRVVVSADHGEYLGERVPPLYRRRYGHGPIGTHPRAAPLYRVPWFEIPGERRRAVRADPPTEAQAAGETPTEQLRALGYAD